MAGRPSAGSDGPTARTLAAGGKLGDLAASLGSFLSPGVPQVLEDQQGRKELSIQSSHCNGEDTEPQKEAGLCPRPLVDGQQSWGQA